jgi:microcystin-dependent protein
MDILTLNKIKKYIRRNLALVASASGEIKLTARATPPTGWLICDGSAISRTTYSNLFVAIGTNYGVGDGSTTFNLPDLKGKIPVGLDSSQTEFDALGKTGGEKTHTLIANEIPAHNHANGSYSKLLKVDGSGTSGLTDNSAGEPNLNSTGTIATVGGNGAHNNLQPYMTLNYIIKC